MYHTTFDYPSGVEVERRLIEPTEGCGEEATVERLLVYHRYAHGLQSGYQNRYKAINADQPKADVFSQGRRGERIILKPLFKFEVTSKNINKQNAPCNFLWTRNILTRPKVISLLWYWMINTLCQAKPCVNSTQSTLLLCDHSMSCTVLNPTNKVLICDHPHASSSLEANTSHLHWCWFCVFQSVVPCLTWLLSFCV